LNSVDDAIDQNAELSTAIVNAGLEAFGVTASSGESKVSSVWKGTATASDLDKARSTLRQFYRDWSAEGAAERTECLAPIITDLQAERHDLGGKKMNVLVPGAGLGRLVFELCKAGFNVEGNEISYHQLLASSYILNYCRGPQIHALYPWIHNFSNHTSRSQHLQVVRIPDVHPKSELFSGTSSDLVGEMSMSASDFLSLYNGEDQRDSYDAVATVFFLDTAPNPIRYIQTIHNCLNKGGIWTNIGPLLWHFENDPPGRHGHHKHGSAKEDEPTGK
jgi:carnosine N-methyltransferase